MFAAPAVGEKGKFDARIEVLTAGGHSSVPRKLIKNEGGYMN
jgi:hypothetical protein